MPFIGSIAEPLRRFFATHAHLLGGRAVYIGCSGNFTVEQILTRQAPSTTLYSNDVSLYSCALGAAAQGRIMPMSVTNPELAWLEVYLRRGPAESVAALLLTLELLSFEKRNTPFSIRMWEAQLVHWGKKFEATVKKVQVALDNIRIEEYTAVDVHDFYPRPDGVSIGFLPTYVGGYEKLYERLEASISWPRPHYEMLTTERREETVRRMAQGDYILYDDCVREDMPCVAEMNLFGKRAVYIYSNLPFPKGLIRRKLKEASPAYDLLLPDEQLDPSAAVILKEAPQPVIDHYRAMFLSKKIEPGSGGPCYLAFAGGKLFGFLIFQTYSQKGGDRDTVYLLSDFVVPSKAHPRLAKLLLMASLCRETREIIEGKLLRRIKAVYTTAFTDKPVSMKYRGVYELAKRGDSDGKKFLNYQGTFNETSLKEVVGLWAKRWGGGK